MSPVEMAEKTSSPDYYNSQHHPTLQTGIQEHREASSLPDWATSTGTTRRDGRKQARPGKQTSNRYGPRVEVTSEVAMAAPREAEQLYLTDEQTVALFFGRAASLQRSLAVADVPANLPGLIEQFRRFVDFRHCFQDQPGGGGEDVAETARRGFARACWKVSQDIALRLELLRNSESEHGPRGFETGDAEALGTRLSELKENYAKLQSDGLFVRHSSWMSDLSTLSIATPEGQRKTPETPAGQEGTETLPKSQRTARPAPAGILQDFILESLSFKSMTDREDEVVDAHGNTLSWILDEGHPTDELKNAHSIAFSNWLQTNELGSIYWITGKPGSGKSTLMRYISESKKVSKKLKTWAGDSDFVKAAFYFWTSGSAEQRSQSGLLRYLLYQLLSHDAQVIASVFPGLWDTLSRMNSKERIRFALEWTIPELTEGFQRFLDQALPRLKVCLFVDGLDEFDGDHQTIVRFFRGLAEERYQGRVKMCLSSRPWSVFEQAFQSSVPNMRLQDLTYHDMTQYVSDNLQRDKSLRVLLAKNPGDGQAFIKQVVCQAAGVFLWVRLVVRKLLEFCGTQDAAVDWQAMRRYLQALPTELDSLFERLIFQIQSEIQLRQTSELFQLVRAREIVASFVQDESSNSLSVWELAFATEGEADNDLAVRGAVAEATDQTMAERCRTAQRHVSVRSAGLLDVFAKRQRKQGVFYAGAAPSETRLLLGTFAAHRITYLHRTVRDYLLQAPRVWERLASRSVDDFDPHLRLLRSYVLRLKTPLEAVEHHRRLDEWYPDIVLALTHARHVERDAKHQQTRFVDELDKTIDWYWAKKSPRDHWALGCFGTYEERKGNQIIVPYPFLALCTKFGLRRYVLDTLESLALDQPPAAGVDDDDDDEDDDQDAEAAGREVETTPLLSRALEFLTSRQKTIFPLSSPGFVRDLLHAPQLIHPRLGPLIGAMNKPFTSPLTHRHAVTPWVLVLRHLRDARRRGWIALFDTDACGTERWTAIVKLLLDEGGADKSAVVAADGWDPETSAAALLGPGGALQVGDWWIRNLGESFR